MTVTATPRHAATALPPFRIPAHYLDVSTQDYPLALLVEDYGDVGTQGLPVAHGVTLLADARFPDLARRAAADLLGEPCEACEGRLTLDDGCGVQAEASGGGNPLYVEGWHLTCLLASDTYGVVPTGAVEWVGVE